MRTSLRQRGSSRQANAAASTGHQGAAAIEPKDGVRGRVCRVSVTEAVRSSCHGDEAQETIRDEFRVKVGKFHS